MNRNIAGAMLAVFAVMTAVQTADAKPKDWNDNGAFHGHNHNFGVNPSLNRNPNGFNNGNAAWKNNYSNGTSNWGNETYHRNDRAGWGNQSGHNNNSWGNNNQLGWNNNNNRFNNVRNIDQTQQRLNDRITRGIASGRLTQTEAERIRSMETRINTLETQFRSDNRLSSHERQRLSTELNKLQDRLRRELSDRQML